MPGAGDGLKILAAGDTGLVLGNSETAAIG